MSTSLPFQTGLPGQGSQAEKGMMMSLWVQSFGKDGLGFGLSLLGCFQEEPCISVRQVRRKQELSQLKGKEL